MKTVLSGLVAFTFMLVAVPTQAHAPSSMVLSLDREAMQLDVSITHWSFGAFHKVDMVDIFLNDKLLATLEFGRQTAMTTHEFSYALVGSDADLDPELELREGDLLAVTAYCNLFGSITREIVVAEEPTTP